MIGQRHELASLQSDLHRNHYHKIIRAFLLNVAIIFLLILGIIYYVIIRPAPHFYASTTTGQIISLTPTPS